MSHMAHAGMVTEHKYSCLCFYTADKSKKVRTCYSSSDPESQPESEPNRVSGTFIGLNTQFA